MGIFDRIVSKLRDIVHKIEGAVEDVHDRLEERRQASLAEELDKLAATKPYKNWRTSTEDLAYLVGEDGSFEGRAELWAALKFGGKYGGSAGQNIRLHARLMEAMPTHGIPWPE